MSMPRCRRNSAPQPLTYGFDIEITDPNNRFKTVGLTLQTGSLGPDVDATKDVTLFWHDVVWPWTVGAIIPGLICGIVFYYLSVPVIRAYQNRREARMRKKLQKMQRQADTAK